MSIENKPREYFDKWVPYYGNYLNGDASIQEQSQRYSIDQQAIVRVIEYRAVEQLKAEIKSLEEDCVTMREHQALQIENNNFRAEITALKSKLKIAVEKLKYVNSYLEDGYIIDEALKEIGEL